jgi:putative solute:sodium symporter small subunit
MTQELNGVEKSRLQDYWKYNIRLTAITLAIWFFVGYVCVFFVAGLNSVVIYGFPFGYYMGAQGSLIVFVVLIFNYAFRMNKADRAYGVQEEEE